MPCKINETDHMSIYHGEFQYMYNMKILTTSRKKKKLSLNGLRQNVVNFLIRKQDNNKSRFMHLITGSY